MQQAHIDKLEPPCEMERLVFSSSVARIAPRYAHCTYNHRPASALLGCVSPGPADAPRQPLLSVTELVYANFGQGELDAMLD